MLCDAGADSFIIMRQNEPFKVALRATVHGVAKSQTQLSTHSLSVITGIQIK